jgi:hypothetical protein
MVIAERLLKAPPALAQPAPLLLCITPCFSPIQNARKLLSRANISKRLFSSLWLFSSARSHDLITLPKLFSLYFVSALLLFFRFPIFVRGWSAGWSRSWSRKLSRSWSRYYSSQRSGLLPAFSSRSSSRVPNDLTCRQLYRPTGCFGCDRVQSAV